MLKINCKIIVPESNKLNFFEGHNDFLFMFSDTNIITNNFFIYIPALPLCSSNSVRVQEDATLCKLLKLMEGKLATFNAKKKKQSKLDNKQYCYVCLIFFKTSFFVDDNEQRVQLSNRQLDPTTNTVT